MPDHSPAGIKTMQANRFRRFWGFAAVAAIYGFGFLFTSARFVGDMPVYVNAVIIFDKGTPPHSPSVVWEFGHLYLRPVGWVLFKCFGGLTPFSKSGSDTLTVAFLLVAFSAICGLICALLFYSLASSLLQGWKALLVTAGMIGFYGFLNFVHAGTSYIPGLMGLLGALWAVIRAIDAGKSSWQYGILGGASFAFAVLMWFPYIVVLPGVLAAALFWNGKAGLEGEPPGRKLRLASWVFVSAAALSALGYAPALVQLNLSSRAGLQSWVSGATHGWSQNKRLIRMASGLPRSFLYTGDNGIALKRYLLKDPYAPVTLGAVIRQHLWGPLIFYAFTVCLICALWRSVRGRRVLWICLAGVLPALGFAVFFESGSVERYLPLYPFLCLAIAYGFSQLSRKAVCPVGILTFVILAIVVNGTSLSIPRMDAEIAPAARRVESLRGKVTSEGLIAFVTLQDEVYKLLTSHPFHPANRPAPPPAYDVIAVANEHIVAWRQDFSKKALYSLDRSQSVWISTRFLAERPEPAWNWTEGDDPRITWKQVPPFFRQFSYSESAGGADGFLKLEPTPENAAKLKAIADQHPGQQ